MLHQLTGVVAAACRGYHVGRILETGAPDARLYFEIELAAEAEQLLADLRRLPWSATIETGQDDGQRSTASA